MIFYLLLGIISYKRLNPMQIIVYLCTMLKFILPSLIGLILFTIPIPYDGGATIPIAIIADFIMGFYEPYARALLLIVLTLSGIITAITSIFKPKKIIANKALNSLFVCSLPWLIVRLSAMVIVIMNVLEVGPELLWGDKTGGFIIANLTPTLFIIFMLAGLLLPLLLNFGLLEFVGVLLTPVMRPIFRLPGRSSIDCVASWLGDGTIGILLTSRQYEQGYYSAREAAVIGTTFSAVSITFSLVIIETVGLGNYFAPFYLTVALAGIAIAIIAPRIPPLSRKKDTYYNNNQQNHNETIPEGVNHLQWALKQATTKSAQAPSLGNFLSQGAVSVAQMWMGVLPSVISIGTVALILVNYTPIFEWLGVPFVPILKFFGLPEAAAAAQCMLVGFTDMFIPAIIASEQITEPITRFTIAALTVCQLIFMAEIGAVLLGSKIPVSFVNLAVIFLQRTIISLPIIIGMAHLLF